MTTLMIEADPEFLQAEQALLDAEGVEARSRTVRLDRLDSTARVVIAGEGPPVLFVPGVMTTGVTLAGLVGQLSDDYRCIMVERPGTGLTPALPKTAHTLELQRKVGDAFLVDILDGLQIDRSHVVCTSLGGWGTFRSLAAHPDRFLRVSALAFQIGARLENVPWSMRMPLIKALTPKRVKATPKFVRTMLKASGMRKTIEAGKFSNEMLDYLTAIVRHTDTFWNETMNSPRAVTPRGSNPDVQHSPELLAKITAAVHLFWGTDDFFGGEAPAREFASLLPNAALQMVEGAGHAVWLDEPKLALAAIRNHLAG